MQQGRRHGRPDPRSAPPPSAPSCAFAPGGARSPRPGLVKISLNPPLAATAHRSKGFDMGLVAVLERAADVEPYASHPAHME